jgi:hypothetical protein
VTATVRGIALGDRNGRENQQGDKEFLVTYRVRSDDKQDGPNIVMEAFGIPRIGDLYTAGHDFSFSAVVVDKSAQPVDDCPYEWTVEVQYSTDFQREPKAYSNPLDEPPEISFGFQERRINLPGSYNNPATPDPNGDFDKGILAPNGDLFDPQPEVPICDPVWSIRKNVASIDYVTLMALANCVNSDYYQGASPRQLQMKPATANRKWHKNIGFYWDVGYQIACFGGRNHDQGR